MSELWKAYEVTTAYTANGRVDHVIDAENNRTEYSYGEIPGTLYQLEIPGTLYQ